MRTGFGEFPVLETWRKCRNVKDGWRGVKENGEKVYVQYGHPCVRNDTKEKVIFSPGTVARIPEKNRIIRMVDGNPVGVILLERAGQRRGR